MIKEAINRILELGDPHLIELGGLDYSSKPLTRIAPPTIKPLLVHTLTAITDYISASLDEVPDRLLIHIADYNAVTLYGPMRGDAERPAILRAELNDMAPEFGRWYDLEAFNIVIQSRFIPNDDSAAILRLIGNVADNSLKATGDDGVSQQVTIKTGISLVGNEIAPNPVKLIPFRTFTEAQQPESLFVFRLKKQGDAIAAALFEADGGAWKNEAIGNIHAFLRERITGARSDFVDILA